MREILFRGKNKHTGEWVEGYFATHTICTVYDTHLAPVIEKIPQSNYGNDTTWEIIPETRGEFTGLTDKNGVKIFEGDIVKTHYANAQKSNFIEQVVFHNGRFCAYFSNQICKQWANLYDGTEHLPQDKSVYMDSVEVIGNIHDNPELLEGGGDNA